MIPLTRAAHNGPRLGYVAYVMSTQRNRNRPNRHTIMRTAFLDVISKQLGIPSNRKGLLTASGSHHITRGTLIKPPHHIPFPNSECATRHTFPRSCTATPQGVLSNDRGRGMRGRDMILVMSITANTRTTNVTTTTVIPSSLTLATLCPKSGT